MTTLPPVYPLVTLHSSRTPGLPGDAPHVVCVHFTYLHTRPYLFAGLLDPSVAIPPLKIPLAERVIRHSAVPKSNTHTSVKVLTVSSVSTLFADTGLSSSRADRVCVSTT